MDCFKESRVAEILREYAVDIDFSGGLKNPKYTYTTITDGMLHALVAADENTHDSMYKMLFEGNNPLIPFKSVKDKTLALKDFYKDNMPFGSMIGVMENMEDARYISIAMKHLIAAQSSQADSIKKYGLDSSEAKRITDSNTGMPTESYDNMANVIGRDIIKSYGKSINVTEEEDFFEVTKLYMAIGKYALDKLEKQGLLSINEDGSIINRRFMSDKSDGSKFKPVSSRKANKSQHTKVIDGVKTISLKNYIPKEYSKEDAQDVHNMIDAVARLVLPINADIPTSETKDIRDRYLDMTLPMTFLEGMEYAQDNAVKINEEMVQILEELYEEINKMKGATTKSNLAKLSAYYTSSRNSADLFGSIDFKAVQAAIDNNMVGTEKDIGRSEAKVLQIINLFDNWDEIKDSPLKHSFQVAKQNRLHVIEQTLNYQQDNHFSRHIFGTSKIQTLNDDSTRYLLAYLSDELKIKIDEITGVEQNDMLEEMLEVYDRLDGEGLNRAITLSSIYNSPKYKNNALKGRFKSTWSMMNYLMVINDIRTGIENETDIKTTFMPEPDGSASGALITLLQVLGRSKEAQAIFEDMASENPEYKDMYAIVMKKLEEYKDLYSEHKHSGKKDAKMNTLSYLDEMETMITDGIVTDEREFVKYPFMTFIYGQQDYNNRKTTAEEIVDNIMNHKDPAVKQKYLDKASEFFIDEDSKQDKDAQRQALILFLSKEDGVIGKLVELVRTEVGSLFEGQQNSLSEIHDLLEKARFGKNGYKQIRIVPPFAWLDDETNDMDYSEMRDMFSTSIEKDQEIMLNPDKLNGANVLTNRSLPNQTSIKVLLQHMTDSAVLMRALNRMFKGKFTDYREGLMLIHDAVGASVEFAMEFEKVYQEELIKVNSEYDFVEAALSELEYAANFVKKSEGENSSLYKDMLAKINELKPEVEASKKAKQKILYNAELFTSFGVNPKKLKEAKEYDYKNAKAKKVYRSIKKQPKTAKVSKQATGSKFKSFEEANTELASVLSNNDFIAYDVETDGLFEDNSNVLEIGYKIGNGKTQKIRIKQDYNVLKNYIIKFKDKPNIRNSQLYSDVRSGKFNDSAISKEEAIAELKKAFGDNKNIISFNGSQFDDLFMKRLGINIETRFDIRYMVNDTIDYTKQPIGKLEEYRTSDMKLAGNDHDADVDVDVTIELAKKISSGEKLTAGVDLAMIQQVAKDSDLLSTNAQILLTHALKVNKNMKLELAENAYYDSATNTAYVTDVLNEEEVVHEAIHGALAQSIENDPVLRGQLKSIFDNVAKHDKELVSGFKGMDTNKRLHEFASIALSNVKFRERLQEVPSITNILTRIAKLVLKALGISQQYSAYTDILNVLSDANYNPNKKSKKQYTFIDVIKKKDRTYSELEEKEVKPKSIFEESADIVSELDDRVARAIQYSIDLSVSRIKNELKGKEFHDKLMKRSPLYKKAIDAIQDKWDNDSFINKMKVYLNVSKGFDNQALYEMEAAAAYADERRASFETSEINRLHKLMKGLYTPEETKSIYSLFSEVPMFAIAKDNTLYDILTGGKTIDEAIAESEESIPNEKEFAMSLADRFIDKTISKKYPRTTKGNINKDAILKLAGLYAIKKVEGHEELLKKSMSTEKYKRATQELIDLSTAIKSLDDELQGAVDLPIDRQQDNLNHYVFDANIEVKAVNENNVNSLFEEHLGWKMLKDASPSKDKLGVMYRDKGDVTNQSGVGVNYVYNPNMHITSNVYYKNSHMYKNSDMEGYTIEFTNEQLDELGVVRDPVMSLVKAYSHKMMLKETQSTRDLITKEYTYDMSNVSENKIKEDIKKGEHLWYIKAPAGTTIDKLDPAIRKKYQVAKSFSDISGFRNEITFIRNDISDFVEGYGELQLGKVGTTLNKVFSILKKAIILQKIHYIIVNPAKQLRDGVSNTLYLMSRNVPITDIYRGYKNHLENIAIINDLNNKLLLAEFEMRKNPSDKLQKKIDHIEKQINKNPLSRAYYAGYMTNGIVELSGINKHTKSGVHKDISNALNKIFKNDDESLTVFGEYVDKFSKFGFRGEEILYWMSKKFDSRDTQFSKNVANSLKEMYEHIKYIKDEKDVASYVQEYMATPSTALVQAGSKMASVYEQLGKATLHDYLVGLEIEKFTRDKGRKPSNDELDGIHKRVSEDVNSSFPSQLRNIPQELRFLEQTGVTKFISFTSRIQPVIFRSFIKNPVNNFITLLMNNYFGSSFETIQDASLLSGRGVFTSPSFGADTVLPTNLLP